MKTKLFVRTFQLLPVFLFWSTLMFAQQLKLGDNPSSQQKSALLELESKSQGLLLPRISDTTSGVITTAPDGMIIYLTLNNSLCIRSNGHWRPLLPEGYAISSLNGQTIAVQSLATTNTAGALGFTSVAGAHTLNIPDATATNSGFVNTNAQTLAGAKTFTNTLTANQDVYLTGINIDNTKDSVLLIDGGKLLKKQLTGLPPVGSAGGDLTGTYPNPAIAAGAVTGVKIAQAGATTGQALKWNGTTWAPAGDDGLTSIGLTMPSLFTVANSPLTANGTIAASLASQTASTIFAAPAGSNGTPTFRTLVAGDIPSLPFSQITGTVPVAQGGTGLTAVGANGTVLTSNGTSLSYVTPSVTLGGDVTGASGANTIAAGAVTGTKIAQAGATTGQVLKWNGTTWAPAADDNSGSISSIGLVVPSFLTVSPATLTANGTFTIGTSTQSPNLVFAGPSTGSTAAAPTFRSLVAPDMTIGTQRLIGRYSNGTGVGQEVAMDRTLKMTTSGFLYVDTTLGVYNASKIQSVKVSLTAPTTGQVLKYDGTNWSPAADDNAGLTSVGLSLPLYTFSNSPLTANGTLNGALSSQTANTFLGAPNGSNGTPAFRTLVAADIPSLPFSQITGTVPVAQGGTGLTAVGANGTVLTSNGTTLSYVTPSVTLAGDVTGASGANTIANSAVTYAKIQNVSASKLLGRYAGTAGVAQEIGLDNTLKFTAGGNLYADSALAVWNASKIQGIRIIAPAPTTGQVLKYDGTNWSPAADNNTGLTSVGLTLPSMFSVTGSPLTANGTIAATLASQTANTIFAAPNGSAGAPTFRTLGISDIQSVNTQKLLGRYSTGAGAAQEVTLDNTLKLTTGGTLYADSSLAVWNASKLQGVRVAATAPTDNYILKYDAATTSWGPEAETAASNWLFTGNSNTDANSFLGTTVDQPMVLKYNNKELFRGTKGVGLYSAKTVSLFNGATAYNAHPLVIKANGPDVLAFEDSTGVITWHWNMLGTGLNFVESNVADYRLFLQKGGNVGVNTSTPTSRFDVNGSISMPVTVGSSTSGTTQTYTMTADDYTFIKTGSASYTITLPDATTCAGRIYVLKKSNTSGTFSVKSNGGSIDGSSGTVTITGSSGTSKVSWMLQSDGSNWYIISALQ